MLLPNFPRFNELFNVATLFLYYAKIKRTFLSIAVAVAVEMSAGEGLQNEGGWMRRTQDSLSFLVSCGAQGNFIAGGDR